MSAVTLVWIVTYRVDSKSAQCELKRYTQESARHFAAGIIDAGGVAVITEYSEAADEHVEELSERRYNKFLDWDKP